MTNLEELLYEAAHEFPDHDLGWLTTLPTGFRSSCSRGDGCPSVSRPAKATTDRGTLSVDVVVWIDAADPELRWDEWRFILAVVHYDVPRSTSWIFTTDSWGEILTKVDAATELQQRVIERLEGGLGLLAAFDDYTAVELGFRPINVYDT